MSKQIIQDHNGVTGVFIPMPDWERIIEKYPNINEEHLSEDFVLSDEQKRILDSRAKLDKSHYRDVDEFIKELELELTK